MSDRTKDESYDDQIAQLIRKKAAKFARSGALRYEEQRDIEQDLLLRWLEIRTRFDASRGSIVTYADIALNNHVRNMGASRRAQRRAGRTDAKIDPELSAGLIYPESTPTENDSDIDQIGREPDYSARDLRIDLRRVLRQLSPTQLKFVQALFDGNVSESARTLKLSRATVYQRIHELREALSEAGLDEYLC